MNRRKHLQLKILQLETQIATKKGIIQQRWITLKEKTNPYWVVGGGFLSGFLIQSIFFKKGRPLHASVKRLIFSGLTVMNLSDYIRPVFRYLSAKN